MFLEGSRHGKLEDKKSIQNSGILEPVLGKEIHGRNVLRGEDTLRHVYSGPLEYVDQPITGLISGVSELPFQYGPGLYVQQGFQDPQD